MPQDTFIQDNTTPEDWDRIEEFMRTFVSKYFLPKKISQARTRKAATVTVPIETLDALIARVEKARAKGQKSVSVGTDNLTNLLTEIGISA